jgi:hypothetical protein
MAPLPSIVGAAVLPSKKDTKNLWGPLPLELRHRILTNADALTKYLNGYLTDQQLQQMPNEGAKIWKIAFEIDWQGDLNLLPKEYLPNVQTGLMSVRTIPRCTIACAESFLISHVYLTLQ